MNDCLIQPNENPANMPFGEDDMVTASELREFVYCARAWSLARHGFAVSREVQSQRDAGIRFHELQDEHTRQGSRRSPLIAGLLLVAAGILFLLLFLLLSPFLNGGFRLDVATTPTSA